MKRELTCIVCPRGCQMKVILDGEGKPLSVEGNFCRRGATYAEDECTNPRRTVTSTVRCKDGSVLPVKTDKTVPKDMIFKVMEEINSVVADTPLHIGDVVIADVAGTGASVIATSNSKE